MLNPNKRNDKKMRKEKLLLFFIHSFFFVVVVLIFFILFFILLFVAAIELSSFLYSPSLSLSKSSNIQKSYQNVEDVKIALEDKQSTDKPSLSRERERDGQLNSK